MRTSTTRRRALRALGLAGLGALATGVSASENDDEDDDENEDAPGNSGDHHQDDDRGRGDDRGNGREGDRGNGREGDRGNGRGDDRGNGREDDRDDDERDDDDSGDDPDDGDQEPSVSVERSDDGSAFTGGQTNRIDLAVDASAEVLVRDRCPVEWSVVAGDDRETSTASDDRYVEFAAAVTEGTRTYLAEAPEDATETGVYEFGPVAYSVDGETWTELESTERTVVLGQST